MENPRWTTIYQDYEECPAGRGTNITKKFINDIMLIGQNKQVVLNTLRI